MEIYKKWYDSCNGDCTNRYVLKQLINVSIDKFGTVFLKYKCFLCMSFSLDSFDLATLSTTLNNKTV